MCVFVCVHWSTEHDSSLLVVFVVSLSALGSSVSSVIDALVSPRRSGKDASCWSRLQTHSGVWREKRIGKVIKVAQRDIREWRKYICQQFWHIQRGFILTGEYDTSFPLDLFDLKPLHPLNSWTDTVCKTLFRWHYSLSHWSFIRCRCCCSQSGGRDIMHSLAQGFPKWGTPSLGTPGLGNALRQLYKHVCVLTLLSGEDTGPALLATSRGLQRFTVVLLMMNGLFSPRGISAKPEGAQMMM